MDVQEHSWTKGLYGKRQQGYSKAFVVACNVGDLDLTIFGLQIASISKKCSHSAQWLTFLNIFQFST